MAKPFSLQPLVNLARQKNDAAIKNLGQLNQQSRSAQEKLEMLNQFRRDYQNKFQQAVQNGMSPVDMRNFQDFIYRLDKAIEQQKNVMEISIHAVNAGRVELSETKRKMQSFDALAERHQKLENAREAKAEQKAQDEYAGRFAATKAAEKLLEELENPIGAHHE